MPDVPSPAELEREIEETRERLAATLDLLVDRAHPKRVARRQADSLQATVKLLFSGEPQVVHRDDGTVIVRQLRTDRAVAAAGGSFGVLVVALWVRRRRRRRRDTRPELVQAAERSLVEARQTGRKATDAVARKAGAAKAQTKKQAKRQVKKARR